MDHERVLKFLMRAGGAILMFAFPSALLPTSWMVAINESLGLAPLADSPLTEYLTRSLSLMYGFHGVVLFVVAADVRRHRPVARWLGLNNVLFGIAMTVVDVVAGMPWWWTVGEGPPVFAVGVAVAWLSGRIADDR